MVSNRFYGPICQVRDWYTEDRRVLGASAAVSASSKQASASAPCWFETQPIPALVMAPDEAYVRLRRQGGTANLSAGTSLADYRWPHGPASEAQRFVATLGSQQVEILRPLSTVANLPSAQQVCHALQAVPAVQRAFTRRVILCPTPHPNSTARSTIGGEAGSGEVTLYPSSTPPTQNEVDNRIMHEIGHNYQGNFWHSRDDVAAWGAAAALDPQAPSRYAQGNSGDDFCEFLIIYNAVRSTACEAAARNLYGHRWSQLERY